MFCLFVCFGESVVVWSFCVGSGQCVLLVLCCGSFVFVNFHPIRAVNAAFVLFDCALRVRRFALASWSSPALDFVIFVEFAMCVQVPLPFDSCCCQSL